MNSKLLAAGIVIWHVLIPVRLYIYARVGAFLFRELTMLELTALAILMVGLTAGFYKAVAHRIEIVDLPFT